MCAIRIVEKPKVKRNAIKGDEGRPILKPSFRFEGAVQNRFSDHVTEHEQKAGVLIENYSQFLFHPQRKQQIGGNRQNEQLQEKRQDVFDFIHGYFRFTG